MPENGSFRVMGDIFCSWVGLKVRTEWDRPMGSRLAPIKKLKIRLRGMAKSILNLTSLFGILWYRLGEKWKTLKVGFLLEKSVLSVI